MKKIIFIALFVLANQILFAKQFTCTIKNIRQPQNTNNVIEFDVYVQNTGNDVLKFQSFQGGVNFNYDGLANGGTITGSYVPNSGDKSLSEKQLAPNWNVNQESKQIRLIAAIQNSNTAAATITKEGIKLGTFRMQNTKPFASVAPNFTWAFTAGSSKTKTTVTSFINNEKFGKSLTTQTLFSYANQGPEYFVESNDIVNKGTNTTAATIKNDISVYPNPVTDQIKVDITSTTKEVAVVKVVDNTGRVVKQVQQDLVEGMNPIRIAVEDLAIGTYQLNVIRKGKEDYTTQILKQ